MPVDSKHPDFIAIEKDWQQIADCIEGQRKIKKEGDKYLPKPNPSDTSPENSARYVSYKKRAVFHNATGRTVSNMVGQCFAVDPVPTVPPEMEPWLDDIDGGGVSAIQQSKKALGYIVAFSRAGLWVDYPKTTGPVSKADAEEGGVRPRCVLIDPREIINWRTTAIGAKSRLSLVVIRETYVGEDDGFETVKKTQYRVLRLVEGSYIIEVYRDSAGSGYAKFEDMTPLDGSGQPLKEIPFTFIGAEANDPTIEKPLMIDISNLNLGHYRNSADYEEAVYMVGQPTPYLAGLTQSWVDDVLKGSIMLGSRACIPLPQGATAGLLQAATNTLPFEAMTQKETLMTALGAKLVEKREVAKTATESGINEANENSILAAACSNISEAYSDALQAMAAFGGVVVSKPEEEILFELNTDFAISRMSPEEQGAILSLYQADLITFEEARDKLKNGGVAYLDDEDAKDQLEQAAEEDFNKAKAELDAQTAGQIAVQAAKTGNAPPTPPAQA